MKIVKQQVRHEARWTMAVCVLGIAAVSMTGCGIGGNGSNSSTTATLPLSHSLSGRVHGGQQPVSAATIQLYAVGTSGLKSASTPLLPTNGVGVVTTDANGNFNITGQYSCTGATQVYLTATGGNSGSGSNSAINMMAPLGSCATLQANAANTFIIINEITTVASAYTLAPFMANYTHIGASGSNPAGLLNAVANFNNLVNLSTGNVGGVSVPTGATLPTTQINTLANVLAACINTASSGSTACSTLLTATSAADTLGAALAIANNPGSSSLLSLFSLSTSSPPFQPALSTVPTDWTVSIKYNASGTFNTPYGIAMDANGNAWITNSGAKAVTELSASGALVSNFTATGLVGPKGIAIDRTGNIWVANTSANTIVEFNGSGVAVSTGSGYSGGGLNGPVAIAMDSAGNAWIANLDGNTVTELNSSGVATSANGSNGFTASGTISGPSGVAIDAAGNVLIANSGNGNVVKLTNAGAIASGSPFTDVALQGTTAVATDSSNNVWATGSTTGTSVAGATSQFSSTGVAASYSPLSSGGLALPVGVATSGTNVWVTNGTAAGSLSQLRLGTSTPISPTAGFGSLNVPIGVAVDASGDVWTANSGDNTVSVFFGLANPVVTPLAANVGP